MIGLTPAPASVRGDFKKASYSEAPGDTAFHDVLNITSGSGILISMCATSISTNSIIKLTIDGEATNEAVITAGQTNFYKQKLTSSGFQLDVSDVYAALLWEFNSSCRVELKQTNGANTVAGVVLYNED